MNLKEHIKSSTRNVIISRVCTFLEKNPEKNVDKLFQLITKLAKDKESKLAITSIDTYYHEIPSVKELIQNILTSTNPEFLKKFFINFLGNAIWSGGEKRKNILLAENTKVPFALLISPSMKCNLHCSGCYAAKYDKSKGLTYDEVDRIIGEARDLGIHYMIILGGEPFFVDFMYDIYKKYNDVLFTPFTNGTLFTPEVADKLASLNNVMPMFSLEGFKEETDSRRGDGTFDMVMNGMDLLKERGIPFGVSSATSTHNMNTVTSDAFIDMLIKKGSKMNWYFMYMPVGEGINIDNMLKPDQRIELGRRTKNIRNTKPYFTIDFFNDAPYVGGCIAGKYYCHINATGDVEPCIFAHIACDNVKTKPLIDIFRSELFKELRSRQPYNKNMLMPCMMIDNTNVIREVSKKVKAFTTENSGISMLYDKTFQSKLDKLSSEYKPYADKAWEEDFHSKGNDDFSKG
ncbi:radical SAM protein [Clostridium uliginosum]|uniref:Radical SAM superfamily enzyme, MoaA/NifB/PqqE/SkfB family n=1 Tax=Clostridium uliginosum TaxID=119641 RepID=A0A1I1S438_9CLOT|nr:radical SAM protein [Clostridium uliginosum]SFD41102.1 Radical SAM superfamily enzyme, MoaA/NifB/PqqE/SkfB family [Clostridium uliginosum]